MGFSQQEHWSSLPFPPPVDHILSELFTMTHPPEVALHGIAHSFIELSKPLCRDKAVIHEGNYKQCSNYRTTEFISLTSKVMLNILQARLQEYVNQELPNVQAGFRKVRGMRDQIANICWITCTSASLTIL